MVIFDLVLWIPAASDLILSDKYLHQNKVSQGLKPKTCGRRALQQRLPMFVNLLSNCWNKLSWNPTPRISHGDKNNLQSLCMALLALMLLNKAPLVWLQSGHIRLSYYASGGPGKWWQGHHDRDIEWNWIGFISYLFYKLWNSLEHRNDIQSYLHATFLKGTTGGAAATLARQNQHSAPQWTGLHLEFALLPSWPVIAAESATIETWASNVHAAIRGRTRHDLLEIT